MVQRAPGVQSFPILSDTKATLDVWSQSARFLSDTQSRDAELEEHGTWDPTGFAGGGSITNVVFNAAVWQKRYPRIWFTVTATYEIPANRASLGFTLPFNVAPWLIDILGDSAGIPVASLALNGGGTREVGPAFILAAAGTCTVYRETSAAFTTGSGRIISVTGEYPFDLNNAIRR